MNVQQQKADLRKPLLKWRRGLEVAAAEEASKTITRRCLSLIEKTKINSVNMYASIATHNEVNTWLLLNELWLKYPQLRIAVPVIHGNNIQSVQTNKQTMWEEGFLRIPEPLDGRILSPRILFDVVIIPVLGFDHNGNRLGYGLGYYDKFLITQPRAVKIGLAYAAAEIKPRIPTEAFDVPLDYVVTEKKVHYFGRKEMPS